MKKKRNINAIIFCLLAGSLICAGMILKKINTDNHIVKKQNLVASSDTSAGCETCKDLPPGVFCDDFAGNTLDIVKWWYGRSQWGNGKQFKNHGVVPENVIVANNRVYFGANGDLNSGSIAGMRKEKARLTQDQPGDRTGGMIVSEEYFGSGSYEVRMRLPSQIGVCSALWTFHYQEMYSTDPDFEKYSSQGLTQQGNENDGYYVTPNHEIDIEIPTAPKDGDPVNDCSYRYARLNTWVGEENYTDDFHDMGFNQSDGKFHVYRFDWHTGGNAEKPRVDFYLDGKYIYTSTTHIPFIKGRFTIGTWFPQWAGGKANFDRAFLEVDWIKITPYGEPNDKKVKETYKNAGMTKCNCKPDNDKYLSKCRLTVF
jgi:beta-glucanase (GH16 family)